MKKILTLAICLMIFQVNFAQSITTVEDVYGGRINAICGAKTGSTILSDTFTVIVSTESANSMFYATATFPTFGTASVGKFTVFPSVNASAGYGSSISKLAFHKASKTAYFIASGNVYSTTTTATSATKVTTSGTLVDIVLSGNYFYMLSKSGSNNNVYIYTIDATTGALTYFTQRNFSSQAYTNLVKGQDNKLYLFKTGTDPQALQFAGDFSSGIILTTTSTDYMASLSSSYSWDAMGVYTDGTVFVGGTNGGTSPYKYIGKTSTFNTSYTFIPTGISGTSGSNIEFRDKLISGYNVYFGKAYSTSKGDSSTWTTFGNTALETHPNDGMVTFFQNTLAGNGILLLTTDAGLGWTKNSGATIADINNGILATQVEDFDMNSSKTFGWLAAKDGIRYVNNYNSSSKKWTTAMWPGGDGSGYYSAEMAGNDTMKAYVGNVRVYKTVDKGTNWTKVFTPEDAPYSFPSVGVRAEAIAVSSYDTSMVMAGFYNQNSGQLGGVFYSKDGGKNWSQLLINASSYGQDVNVFDIEMTYDSGKIVAYIGIEYQSTSVKGMYKAQWNGSSWSVRFEDVYGAASKYSITDIVIASKDTIAAVGAFYNPTMAKEYPIYFNISRTVRNAWYSSASSAGRTGGYTACAWNKDTMYYAYDDSILYDIISFNSTTTSRVGEALYNTVDIGTEINVLYYDELLAGSTTGFRSIKGASKSYEAPVLPTVSITANKTAVCVNTNVTFTASITNGGNMPTYKWKVNNVVMGGNSSTFTTNALPNNAVIVCGVTNSFGSANSNEIVMTIYGSPFIAPITGNMVGCSLNTDSYVGNTTPNGVWGSSNTSVATINSTGRITSKANGATNISYTVTNAFGCTNSVMTVFKVSSEPVPQPITGASQVCVGSNVQLSNGTANGVWSSDNNRATINASGLVTGANAGIGNIRYTKTNADGCSNFITRSITVNASPLLPDIGYAAGTIIPRSGSAFCNNKTFTLTGNPANGTWASSNNSVVTVNGSGTVNTVGVGSASLSYTITVNGCSSTRNITGNVVNCSSRGLSSEIRNQKSEIHLYPNPATTSININIDNLFGTGSVAITDLYGKQVKQQNLSLGINTIDVSKMAKGMYLVTVQKNNESITQKIIIQ